MSVAWNNSTHEIAGTKMHLSRAGSGRPLLILHHDIGTPERLEFYDFLAGSFDVLVPHHPGWGRSERPQWLRHPRDIAAMHAWLLADLGLGDVSLVGLGFGGWIAAEMASQAPATYSQAGAGRTNGHQAAGRFHHGSGDRVLYRLSARRLP